MSESDPGECNDINRLKEWLDCCEKNIIYSEASEGMVGMPMINRCRERQIELRRRIRKLEDQDRSSDDSRVDDALLNLLNSVCASVSTVGCIYFKRWSMPDGTAWYKVGVTTNPRRRDAEQNVLPVAAETLACVDVGSMDRARALEAAIHGAMDSQRITDANNRELFHLTEEQEGAVMEAIKALG